MVPEKATVFNLLTGVYKPTEGIITLDGKDITGKNDHRHQSGRYRKNLPEYPAFKDLSVIDNVKVGLHNHMGYSTITGILRLPKYYKCRKADDGGSHGTSESIRTGSGSRYTWLIIFPTVNRES